MRILKRAAAVSVTSLALALVPATAALAHDCLVGNNGAATTGRSSVWFSFTITDAIGFVAGDLGETLTDEQVAEAEALAAEAGLPTAFKVRTNKLIGEGSNGNFADGRGVEWISTSPIVGELVGIVISVL